MNVEWNESDTQTKYQIVPSCEEGRIQTEHSERRIEGGRRDTDLPGVERGPGHRAAAEAEGGEGIWKDYAVTPRTGSLRGRESQVPPTCMC